MEARQENRQAAGGQDNIVQRVGPVLSATNDHTDDEKVITGDDRNDNLCVQLDNMYMDCWDEADEAGKDNNWSGKGTDLDHAIGALEDIVMKPSFQTLFNAFLDSHYTEFSKDESQEEQDQNFCIFMNYSSTIGTYLEHELATSLDHFDMEVFLAELRSREDLMDNEIIDMIFSLMDYTKFKELMVDYSAMKSDNGELCNLMASGISVKKIENPDILNLH